MEQTKTRAPQGAGSKHTWSLIHTHKPSDDPAKRKWCSQCGLLFEQPIYYAPLYLRERDNVPMETVGTVPKCDGFKQHSWIPTPPAKKAGEKLEWCHTCGALHLTNEENGTVTVSYEAPVRDLRLGPQPECPPLPEPVKPLPHEWVPRNAEFPEPKFCLRCGTHWRGEGNYFDLYGTHWIDEQPCLPAVTGRRPTPVPEPVASAIADRSGRVESVNNRPFMLQHNPKAIIFIASGGVIEFEVSHEEARSLLNHTGSVRISFELTPE